MGESAEQQLKNSGCKLVKFHKWNILNLGVMNERDHRKIVVLDGRVALVGGHCIVDDWLGNAEDKEHFGDVSVRLRGPVVQASGGFSENWVGDTGELFMGDDVFPSPGTRGLDHRPRGLREAGGLCARGEDPAPHGNLLRAAADLDSKSLLHPGARGHRSLRKSRRARR